MPETYDSATALVVVDVQNDFADPAGGLYVQGGEEVVVAANLAALVTVATARRRVGGITGDVLGAAVEIALTAALVTASVLR